MELKGKNVIVAAILAFTALQAQAGPSPELIKATLETEPSCSNFVRYDDANLYLGFGSYRRAFEEPRHPIPARLRVVPFGGAEAFDLATKDAAIDIATEGSTAFVLTYSSIEEWDLVRRERVAEHATYAINGPLAYKEHAEAMARYKNKLVIAHGRLGISVFDIKARRLTNQFRLLRRQLPLESMATGVTVQGDRAYVLMDNFHLPPPGQEGKVFRGIVLLNMTTESVASELGGIDPGADSILSDSRKAVVSFMGIPIWKYGLGSLDTARSRVPEPEGRVWRFPVNGSPTGHPSMDEKHYYTCFIKIPADPQGPRSRVPMALDRKELGLD